MAAQKSPVHRCNRTVFAGSERAGGAEIAHAIEVGAPCDVGLGGHQLADGEGAHAEHIGLDDPVVGVGVGGPEPVGERAWRHVQQRAEVGEHHEPRDVVGVALFPHRADGVVEASEAARGAAPEGDREGAVGVEERGRGGAVRVEAGGGDVGVRWERAQAVGRAMHVAHELAPAEDLTYEALLAREGDICGDGVRDDPLGQQAMKIQKRRDPGVEQVARSVREGVLVGPEAREAFGAGPRPERLGVGGGSRERGEIELAGVMGVLGGEEFADLAGDGVRREARRHGSGRVSSPGLAVLRIEAPASAARTVAVHEDAGAGADDAVEGVHPPHWLRARAPEVVLRREPSRVGNHDEGAGPNEIGELDAKFALGGLHHRQRAQLCGEPPERLGEPRARDLKAHRHPARRLLQREVSPVREDIGELL